MASIVSRSDEKIFKIRKWGGLNENPDGDTKLKMGEAASMRNWKVTRDGNLQRRGGTKMIMGLMAKYAVEISSVSEVARIDSGVSSTLPMFETAEAGANGFAVLGGNKAAVTYENSVDYTGYFWQEDDSHVWQLDTCIKHGDDYVWGMKRVRVYSESADSVVAGLWSGNVAGQHRFVAACDGKVWSVFDGNGFAKKEIGEMNTENGVFFFGFANNMYAINGSQYKVWDGETFGDVEGYVPIVAITVPPTGGGEVYESANLLTAKRRVWFSPDGSATTFVLPEKDLLSIDRATDMGKNEALEFTADVEKGTVTFAQAPAQNVNTIEVEYTAKEEFSAQVKAMRFAEFYNGTQDTRVFLYGDGTNITLYSGLDYNGVARADYFPAGNEIAVGEANTPVTSLIRHYSRLIAYKSGSAWSIQYGTLTLEDNRTVAAFYCTPINRSIGNAAMGQARLVLNSPYTIFGNDVYEWRNNSSYSSNLSVDERQAKRISDRIYATINSFDAENCVCHDDNDAQEYYICCNGAALIYNYAADAWYYYTGFDARCLANFRGELYFGTSNGRLEHLSYEYRTDDGEVVDAYWESGSMDFERDWQRKYSQEIFVGIKPEYNAQVNVTVQTDRKSQYAEKVVAKSFATFVKLNFAKFSFNTNRKPSMTRLKIKAKKFTFYKLILENAEAGSTATVVSVDIKVRYSGEVK